MRCAALFLLLALLPACQRYGCGEYTITLPEGTYTSGEWCGLFGSYGYHFEDTGETQVIISPDSGDFDTDALFLDKLAITDLRFPDSLDYTGQTLTLNDGVTAVCGISPDGAGSGSLRFEPATSASITLSNASDRTLTGDRSLRLTWDISCPSTTTTGDDRVELDDLPTEP